MSWPLSPCWIVRWARWRLGALWLGLSRPFPEWMAGRCAVQLRLGLLIAARLDEGLVLLVLENLDRLENAAQVNTHRLDRALAVARAEPVDHGGMLGHHGRMLAQVGHGEIADAVHLRFRSGHEQPGGRMAGECEDEGVHFLVGAEKALVIAALL